MEPMFLAHVSDAMWQHADVEMRKFARKGRGFYAFFYVCQVHHIKLVFSGAG